MKNLNRVFIAIFGIFLFPSAQAMPFACTKVIGERKGDFKLSRICINDQYALMITGNYEQDSYFYEVAVHKSLQTSLDIDLVPRSTTHTLDGKALNIALNFTSSAARKNLVEALVNDHGASVEIAGHPRVYQPYDRSGGVGFELRNIDLSN